MTLLIGHLKPGTPAIYPFHTSLFIHSLKQDKGSRLPTLDMSLTSESINQSINHYHLPTLAASLQCWVMFEKNQTFLSFSQLVASLHTIDQKWPIENTNLQFF